MVRKRIKNERFPHYCKIYRMVGETSFSEGEELVLYEGKCRKYANDSLRTFRTNGVVYGDFAINFPNTEPLGIHSGDVVDVKDKTGEYLGIELTTDPYVGTMGTTIYFDMKKN